MSYSSCSCFVCLTGPYTFVYMFKSSSNVFLWVQFSHTDHWMFNMAPHGKELSEDLRVRIVALHKDGLGLKKFGNSLGLSYSTVARVIQRLSKTGFTRNRPRKVDQRSWVLVLCVRCKSCFKKQMLECCQHCFRGCRSGRSACQCSDHTPHTSTSRFAWPSSQKEASSEAGSQKKPANSLLKTTWPRAWITGTMSCGLMCLR